MLYDYLALIFFIAFAVFVPVSLLLASKMLRKDKPGNPAKDAPYESAEFTIGSHRDVINEYLPFFAIFLPFEIIAIFLLLWSVAARSIDPLSNVLVVSLAFVAMLFGIVGYKMTSDKHGRI